MERSGGGALFGWRKMPLAHAKRVVSGLEQHLRKHAVLERHPAIVSRKTRGHLHNRGHPIGVVIAAGQHASAARRAKRRGVHVCIAQPVFSDTVDIGRVDQAPESGHLTVADVIQHEEDHVG